MTIIDYCSVIDHVLILIYRRARNHILGEETEQPSKWLRKRRPVALEGGKKKKSDNRGIGFLPRHLLSAYAVAYVEVAVHGSKVTVHYRLRQQPGNGQARTQSLKFRSKCDEKWPASHRIIPAS